MEHSPDIARPTPARLLVVHFVGIGNGITALPILKRLEETVPGIGFFHTANPVFESPEFMEWFNFRGFLGTVPAGWRRFAEDDWEGIEAFIRENRIGAVVNLRNEGPGRDTGYFRFRERMAGTAEFWHLDQAALRARPAHRLLVDDQVGLFAEHGVELGDFDRGWLRRHLAASGLLAAPSSAVGFFTGVNESVKRWPPARWTALGRLVLRHTPLDVVVYAGAGEHELLQARAAAAPLQAAFPGRVRLVEGLTLHQLCASLSALSLVVSNDTSCVHIAAALGLPTVGLYFSTNAAIWGGASDRFRAVQSRTGLECPAQKRDAGNCTFYYGGCPAPCMDEVSPERVFAEVMQLALPRAVAA
ncbi:MAG TPA: glycosyltransferase family 9 protein [Longimicrobium sp.]|nr:glycosyltransferase family 9 protein [Longimicrobium sp.]